MHCSLETLGSDPAGRWVDRSREYGSTRQGAAGSWNFGSGSEHVVTNRSSSFSINLAVGSAWEPGVSLGGAISRSVLTITDGACFRLASRRGWDRVT